MSVGISITKNWIAVARLQNTFTKDSTLSSIPSLFITSSLITGGERVWRWRRRGSLGWVGSSVWGVCMEARGGRPLPSPGHRCTAVSNRGAVWAADPWSDWSSCHAEPQPAQPVEGHGGNLHEAQWEPGEQPRLQSHTHWVLTSAFHLCFCRFPCFLSVLISVPNYTFASLLLLPNPILLSHFSLSLTFPSLCEETVPKYVTIQGTINSFYQFVTSFTFIVF